VILKDAGVDCFRVFLYADEEHRWSRAEEIAENGDADLKRYLSKRDSMRETYYKTYTGHDFGDVHDYDICLDTGKLGYERCISVLTQIMEGLAAK
jgi:cytidylate kinase